MDKIASLMEMLAPLDGSNTTNLPRTAIYKETRHRGRQPFLYNQGIVLIGQGSKRVHLGNIIYAYNPETYLVVSVPIPAECEIFASKEEALLALIIDIDVGMLNRIISHMDEHVDHSLLKRGEKHRGIYVAAETPMIKDVVSAFHRAFNNVATSSPIQYIKKIRLNKARDLLLEQRVRVSEAAVHVGYENAVQFSREFKRYFGNSPSECRNNVSGR